MSPGARFRCDPGGEERRGVVTVAGEDTHTRLPLRVYRFSGAPRGDPLALDHPNLPGVVAIELDGEETRLVTLASTAYRPAVRTALSPEQVLQACQALAAVHAAGITHGDVHRERLLVGPDGHLLLEGAGVPWLGPVGEAPSQADDVRALGLALLASTGDLPAAVYDVLRKAAADPADTADGVRLAEATLRAIEAPARAAASEAVVKDLPPGGIYRSGEDVPLSSKPLRPPPPPTPQPRPPWIPIPRTALALVAVALAALALAWLVRARDDAPPTGTSENAIVLDVRVAPDDAPPLEIVVIDSPIDSELAPGTRLGRAPRRVLLDRPGRWVLQGSFGDLDTEPVEVLLPGPGTVVLVLPDDDTPTPPR